MSENKFESATWDSNKSTYKQIIRFTNGKSLIGYSAKRKMHEGNSKTSVLINWILRMADHGYLDPQSGDKSELDFIEYHEIHTNTHLFNLHYTFPEIIDDKVITSLYYKPVLDFLKSYYTMVREKKSIDEIIQKLYIKDKSKADEHLNWSKRRFLDFPAVESFAQDLVKRELYPIGQVQHFVNKYCETHFGKTPNWKFE